MDLDAKTKLRRFCFLGSLEPVYVHLRDSVNLSVYWPQLQEICKALDDISFVQILKEVMHECTLVRRDEVLFAYAAYLATDLDIKWKTAVRKAFPALVTSDDDLFLFCKYASLIQKEQRHKGFSRTMRKAITAWYEQHTPEDIRSMWLTHRGEHGFTHKVLIKLCRINDELIGAPGVVSPYFKTCTELLKAAESCDASPTPSALTTKAPGVAIMSPSIPVPALIPESQQNGGDVDCANEVEKTKSCVEMSPSVVVSMSKLRTTKNKVEALKIIRKFKLHYSQVPKHLLCYPPIIEALVPTMSYLQLLKCWRNLARHNHFDNPKIMKLCQALLENKKKLHKGNIHPIVFLMQMHQLGIRGDLTKLPSKKVQALKMSYFKELYAQSFGQNQGTGLRMHITINLQANYKKKFLKNHKKLSFYDAAIALAFGYYKKESQVEVYHWVEEKMKLEQIPWTKEMDIEAAIACCDKIQNIKNAQRLVTPVLHSLPRKQLYDVFMTIVPTAGRGNPKQNSEFLCKFIDKYREVKNPKAKYVIIDLLKFRKSMAYSNTRNENILEICGLDEHTTNLITNFVLNRFG